MIEIANALSMILPAVAMILYAPKNVFGYASIAGSTCNAVVSCAYHLTCHAKLNIDNVNCAARKLDQTFIHIACVFYAYGGSKSMHYTALNGAVNTQFIRMLWQTGPHDTAKLRRVRVFMATLLYVAPILFRDVRVGLRIVCIFLASSAAFLFNPQLHCMGHTMFHVGLGVVNREIALSI